MTGSPVRIAAVAGAPVFYQVPLYRRLARDPRVDLTVYYASSGGARPYDAGFGERGVQWDVDLLDGYRSVFLNGADQSVVTGGFFALRGWDAFGHIRRTRPDVVWVHGFSYLLMWIGMAGAWLNRTSVMLREEQTLLQSRPVPKRWIRALVLRALFANVAGLYIGSNNRDYFAHYGVAEDRLSFVPYCVDNGALREDAARLSRQRSELRAAFGVADARPVVLFVGKLTETKQPLATLGAFARARRDRPCALLVVGEGPLEAEMRERVLTDAIPDVHFAGFLNRSEIARAYVASDVFVLPSKRETWGLVVNEALNFGLPVVVSDAVGSARDLVEPGRSGFLFPADDTTAFASALSTLIGDVDLRRSMGQRGLEIVEAWNYDAAARGVVEACERAVRRRR